MSALVESLKSAIKSGDHFSTLSLLESIQKNILETKDPELVKEITTPAIYNDLRTGLETYLSVPLKTTQIKGVYPNRVQRSIVFCKALILGVKRKYE